MIKQGEVAFLKTTGEGVFVLEIKDPSPKLGDKELIVEVRRPVAGQGGIQHKVETFYLNELESYDEQKRRFLSEREEVLRKFGPQAANEQTKSEGFLA